MRLSCTTTTTTDWRACYCCPTIELSAGGQSEFQFRCWARSRCCRRRRRQQIRRGYNNSIFSDDIVNKLIISFSRLGARRPTVLSCRTVCLHRGHGAAAAFLRPRPANKLGRRRESPWILSRAIYSRSAAARSHSEAISGSRSYVCITLRRPLHTSHVPGAVFVLHVAIGTRSAGTARPPWARRVVAARV